MGLTCRTQLGTDEQQTAQSENFKHLLDSLRNKLIENQKRKELLYSTEGNIYKLIQLLQYPREGR